MANSNGKSKLLTRAQAASLLGVTERELRTRDGKDFHPVHRQDGSWLYEPAEIGAVLLRGKRETEKEIHAATGTTAAAAFKLFQASVSMAEVVISLEQRPEVVRELRREYDRLSGALCLSPATLKVLTNVLRSPIGDENGLVKLVEGIAARAARADERTVRSAQTDAQNEPELGDEIDPATGERRPIGSRDASDAFATLRALWARAPRKGSDGYQPRDVSQTSTSDRETK
jgi:hypothetical protein